MTILSFGVGILCLLNGLPHITVHRMASAARALSSRRCANRTGRGSLRGKQRIDSLLSTLSTGRGWIPCPRLRCYGDATFVSADGSAKRRRSLGHAPNPITCRRATQTLLAQRNPVHDERIRRCHWRCADRMKIRSCGRRGDYP